MAISAYSDVLDPGKKGTFFCSNVVCMMAPIIPIDPHSHDCSLRCWGFLTLQTDSEGAREGGVVVVGVIVTRSCRVGCSSMPWEYREKATS